MEQPETIEALERAERRRRTVSVAVVAVLVVAVFGYLFVPRTVASGEIQGQTWRLRIAPIGLGSDVTLTGAVADDADRRPVARSGGLDETAVWHIGDADTVPDTSEDEGPVAATVVVGPTPDDVASVRVTSDLGVGEARVVRIGWRRYHVDHLPGHVQVEELVAIDDGGRPIEVSDVGSPDEGSDDA